MYHVALKRLFARKAKSNKYDFGHVLVIGGSPGMVGSPFLVAEAALRIGAGLVTVASQSEVIDALEKRVAEIMTLRIPKNTRAAVRELKVFIAHHKVTCVVLGPGMAADQAPFIRKISGQLDVPVVLDGGGLSAFTGQLKELATITKPGNFILTPHDGEYQKLAGATAPEKLADRKKAAAQLAKQLNAIFVLKGHKTLVARPSGRIYSNETGNPGMATAGSGDVLSGVIAGLVAQKISVADATDTAVLIHGMAGDLAAHQNTQPGMIASDIIEYLPAALSGLLQLLSEPK